MNTARRIAKNTFALLISGIFSQLLQFAAIVYIARVLGPENFGKISFATAVIVYFTMAANWGLPLLGTREIARDKTKIDEYFSNIILLRLGLATISFIALLILLRFINKPDDVKALILIYGIGVLFSALMLDWLFQGLEKMEYIGLGKGVLASVFTGLIFVFVKDQGQLFLIPYFQIVANLIAVISLIVMFLRQFGIPIFRFNLKLCKIIFSQSIPLGVSIILIQIIHSIDIVTLGFMRSDTEIGYYNSAYKIILPLIMVGAVYFDAVFPVASRYYATSLNSLKKLQTFNAKIISLTVFPLAFGGTALALPIIDLIYGHGYHYGVRAFQILIWSVVLSYLNMIFARGLWACNKQGKYLKIVLVQAIISIILNFILIKHWGIIGASITRVFSEFVGFFFYYREFNKIVFVPLYRHIYNASVASIIMTFFLCGFEHIDIRIRIIYSIMIYFLYLFFVKGITRDDIMAIRSLFINKSAEFIHKL